MSYGGGVLGAVLEDGGSNPFHGIPRLRAVGRVETVRVEAAATASLS
jgi:hypothetical protein